MYRETGSPMFNSLYRERLALGPSSLYPRISVFAYCAAVRIFLFQGVYAIAAIRFFFLSPLYSLGGCCGCFFSVLFLPSESARAFFYPFARGEIAENGAFVHLLLLRCRRRRRRLFCCCCCCCYILLLCSYLYFFFLTS